MVGGGGSAGGAKLSCVKTASNKVQEWKTEERRGVKKGQQGFLVQRLLTNILSRDKVYLHLSTDKRGRIVGKTAVFNRIIFNSSVLND